MIKNICIVEDEKFENLLPLVYMRPVYDLRCGILTLKEKILNLPDNQVRTSYNITENFKFPLGINLSHPQSKKNRGVHAAGQ